MKYKIVIIFIAITLITVGWSSLKVYTLSKEEKLADFEQL